MTYRGLTHKINCHSKKAKNLSYPSNLASMPGGLTSREMLSLLGAEVLICLKKKISINPKWNQICLSRKVFLNLLLSWLVSATLLPFVRTVPRQTLRIHLLHTYSWTECSKQHSETFHMKTHTIWAVFFASVQRFLSQLSKLHSAYNSLCFDMSHVGERDDFHLILTKQLSTTSSFPLFHFNKQGI